MNEHDEDRIEGLERLARRRKPARDLWPGIEARIARPRRSRWITSWPGVQFALAASLVAGLAGVFSLQMARVPAAPAQVASAGDFAGVGRLESHSRAIVKANLSIVKSAESQLRQALAQDPDSQSLRALLASTENRGRALRALL